MTTHTYTYLVTVSTARPLSAGYVLQDVQAALAESPVMAAYTHRAEQADPHGDAVRAALANLDASTTGEQELVQLRLLAGVIRAGQTA